MRFTPEGFAKYDAETKWSHVDDYLLNVKRLGYTYISEMIYKEYKKLKSTIKVGKEIGRLSATVLIHLHRMKVPIRKKGGANHTINTTGIFIKTSDTSIVILAGDINKEKQLFNHLKCRHCKKNWISLEMFTRDEVLNIVRSHVCIDKKRR